MLNFIFMIKENSHWNATKPTINLSMKLWHVHVNLSLFFFISVRILLIHVLFISGSKLQSKWKACFVVCMPK